MKTFKKRLNSGILGILSLLIVWNAFEIKAVLFAEETAQSQTSELQKTESLATTCPSYGVCAHLGGGEEHQMLPQNLLKIQEAGIEWVRADFSWSGVENPKGVWHFEHLDRLFDELDKVNQGNEKEKNNFSGNNLLSNEKAINILPILDYDVSWASPAYLHLEEWKEYVRQIVLRYKDRMPRKYFEVWNEPNLEDFWRARPNGADYAILLKATYETIKEIDPEIQVVYGGLSGVPFDFFEESLKAGAGAYFDVLNIHPYRGGLISVEETETFVREIQQFNLLLKKYGIPEKSIWITEMGWATPPTLYETERRILEASLKILYPNEWKGKIAILTDQRFEPSIGFQSEMIAQMIPENIPYETIQLEQLKTLDVEKYPILYLPPSECCPTPFFDSLIDYVRQGGTLILFGGVPFYYDMKQEGDRIVRLAQTVSEEYRSKLRIGWKAFWTSKETPESAPLTIDSDAAKAFGNYLPVLKGTRFLTPDCLKEGDRMIPLLTAQSGDFSAPSVVIYDFNSDYRGNIILSTLSCSDWHTNISSVDNQAVFLPQAILSSFAAGIDVYFWYEFHAPERDNFDKEHHFGIVHQDLSPKPAYLAYQALTQARPGFSISQKRPALCEENVCIVEWVRPDGQKGWAIWTPNDKISRQITFQGDLEAAFNYLGVPQSVQNNETIELSPQILYLIGPDNVKIKKSEND